MQLKSLLNNLLKFLEIQLFLSLLSMPILISWGISISLLSPIGNLIFTPFITAFIFISLIIFITQLLMIPNNYFIKLLEIITFFWKKVMQVAGNSCIAIVQPPIFVLLLIPVISFLAVFYIYKTQYSRLIILFFLNFFVLFCINFLFKPENINFDIKLGSGKLSLIVDKGQVTLSCQKPLKTKSNFDNFINYKLLPELIKKTGCNYISSFKAAQPSKTAFAFAKKLQDRFGTRIQMVPFDKS